MIDEIDLTGADFAADNLGEMWLDFKVRCVESAAIQFTDAYNLITISFPDNFMDVAITQILIDESMDTSDTIMHIRKLFIDNLVDCLQIMGIIIDKDYLDPNSLVDLIYILNSLYSFGDMEDILGLADILEDELSDPKDRVIQCMSKLDPSYNTENFCYLIEDVALNVSKGILVGLNILDQDDTDYMDPALKARIIANKPFLKGTLAETHIKNGGAAGLNPDPLLTLFTNDLGTKLIESPVLYFKEVLGLLIISALPSAQIEKQFLSTTEQFSQDMETVYKAQAILEQVKLHE